MNQDRQNQKYEKPVEEFEDKVVQIKRVSKKTKGGNQASFTALVVTGDKKNRVGVGLGKAKNVADAIKKAISRGRKSLITLELTNDTIPSSVKYKFKGALVLLRPGKPGSGLIAGGPVRAVAELSGIKSIVSKVIGSKTKSVNVWATFKALSVIAKK
jgi:small subunit ribosomal protein S5